MTREGQLCSRECLRVLKISLISAGAVHRNAVHAARMHPLHGIEWDWWVGGLNPSAAVPFVSGGWSRGVRAGFPGIAMLFYERFSHRSYPPRSQSTRKISTMHSSSFSLCTLSHTLGTLLQQPALRPSHCHRYQSAQSYARSAVGPCSGGSGSSSGDGSTSAVTTPDALQDSAPSTLSLSILAIAHRQTKQIRPDTQSTRRWSS